MSGQFQELAVAFLPRDRTDLHHASGRGATAVGKGRGRPVVVPDEAGEAHPDRSTQQTAVGRVFDMGIADRAVDPDLTPPAYAPRLFFSGHHSKRQSRECPQAYRVA